MKKWLCTVLAVGMLTGILTGCGSTSGQAEADAPAVESQGTETVADATEVTDDASMMLIHCHPSGNIFPSKADTMMTDRMNKLCELIGIPLLDHIIVGGDNRAFFSFKEKGMIDNPRITLSTDYRNLDIKSPLVAEQGKAR